MIAGTGSAETDHAQSSRSGPINPPSVVGNLSQSPSRMPAGIANQRQAIRC